MQNGLPALAETAYHKQGLAGTKCFQARGAKRVQVYVRFSYEGMPLQQVCCFWLTFSAIKSHPLERILYLEW